MESAQSLCGFLLLVFITGAHLNPDHETLFQIEGEDVTFQPSFSDVDDHLLYRVHRNGDLLLVNCSQPDSQRQQLDGYKVECNHFIVFYLQMLNLALDKNGDYRVEGWRGGNVTEQRTFRLIVCAEGGKRTSQDVSYDASVVLCSLNSTLGHGSSLQLYQYDLRLKNNILVLDTNSSLLEPLVEDVSDRLKVDFNTSKVTLSGVMRHDVHFHCIVWRGAQCKAYSYMRLYILSQDVFADEKESITLLCISKGELFSQVHWTTPTGHVHSSLNQTHPQEVMSMLNGNQTGNFSLIIPSLSLNHSGTYECIGSDLIKKIDLLVCTKLSTLDMIFSHGEKVLLNITDHLINLGPPYHIQWYHQKVLEAQVLIVDFNSDFNKALVSLPEDLKGKVTVFTFNSNSSLSISNLTSEDSGVYTWRAYGWVRNRMLCSKGSIRLVYRDPFGVHFSFYRAYATLISCGLLGLLAAVIWFTLKSRKVEEFSGHQNGDDDLYDGVEMSKLNKPLPIRHLLYCRPVAGELSI